MAGIGYALPTTEPAILPEQINQPGLLESNTALERVASGR
jgi:hypothetical protein